MPRPLVATAVVGFLVFIFGCHPAVEPKPTAPAVRSPAPESAPQLPQGDPPRLAIGRRGAVTSAEAQASEAGLAILRKGGNAIDAAVAVGFALAVTHPSAGNLGGGGFMVVRMADGTVAALDYRERAPGKASRDMYLNPQGELTNDRLVGPKAAGIPGTVAGMAMAHARFGRLPWAQVLEPAVRLASEGSVLDEWHALDLERGAERMLEAQFEASALHYLKADRSNYRTGELWKQPELAETIRAIASDPRAFYEGPIARALVDGVAKAGGIWQLDDLAQYVAVDREPIVFPYRDHEIITMPPPSAGGVVLRQLLAAAEMLELDRKPWRSVDEIHLYVETARRTYADRNLTLADPDFVPLPMTTLLDVAYVARRMTTIDPQRATPSSEIQAGVPPVTEESHETTHYSVVDAEGNAVANTYTLNLGFGSGFVVAGVLLNNEMDDFAAKPGFANAFGLVQGEQNRIEPGKRMLSSMTPTIVVRDQRLRAVVGTPGGPTITTTVAQIIRAIIDYGLPLEDAVESVRVHHQWLPDVIWTEERIPADIEAELVARGHTIRKRPAIGHANCIEVDLANGTYRAVADVDRDGGMAVAY